MDKTPLTNSAEPTPFWYVSCTIQKPILTPRNPQELKPRPQNPDLYYMRYRGLSNDDDDDVVGKMVPEDAGDVGDVVM